MQIYKTQNNYINFKRVQLSQIEEQKALKMLSKLAGNKVENEIEILKFNLFEMFDSHFQNELSNYSNLYTHKEDFIQGIYLRFFELLTGIQEKKVSTGDFLEKINKIIKVDKDERKETDYSLDSTRYKDSKTRFSDYITSDNLPIYLSQRSDEEREKFKAKFDSLKNNANLTLDENEILNLKLQNKNYVEIVNAIGKSYTSAKRRFFSARVASSLRAIESSS